MPALCVEVAVGVSRHRIADVKDEYLEVEVEVEIEVKYQVEQKKKEGRSLYPASHPN